MKPSLAAFAALAALAAAAPAGVLASETTIANGGAVSPPSCPANPCDVVTRTTAVQVRDGSDAQPFRIESDGRIVSWSVTLAVPTLRQIHYFDTHEGGTARASIALLRPAGRLAYKLAALSPVVHLQPYFGKTAEIRLSHPLRAHKGEVVALAVPTWLPALALNYPRSTAWRASRSSGECSNVTLQTMQSVIGARASYGCVYKGALIPYAASERSGSQPANG